MNEDNENIFTICWFDEEQWDLIARLDPNGVDDSYSQWRKNANKAFTGLKDKGLSVNKVLVNTGELVKWCHERNITPNSKARSEYAAFLAQKRHEKHNSMP